ncbi:PEPxxWA-CTERM sorting domain-containing protein [Sphingomonas sp.]|uniref:PEPxxWA-CTERM sorting domain-containing protein n=1 Tax=Sphingomonas sp. TaxID=28214 RepID=UPI003CC579D1
MNKAIIAAALATATLAAPALATPVKAPTPTIIYTPNVYSLPGWTTATVFESFTGAANTGPGGTYKPVSGETVAGGVYARSLGGNTYLEVDPGGSYKVSFSSMVQYLSFNVWSWAASDTATLTFRNGTTLALAGGAIFGVNGASKLGTNGTVIVDMTGQSGIASIQFANGDDCNAFFLDNLASAAPEPGSWALMILGFGLAGATLRSRRRAGLAFA